MVKYYKPGKVVIVLNGKYAGAKGIIVKPNYDGSKERKYPHCLVVGLSKGPKKPTKRNLAKLQSKIQKIESSPDSNDKLNTLKSFGVFIKYYNMSHLLATRYTVKEDFGINKHLDKLDALEKKVKEDKSQVEAKEKNKKEENAKELESLKAKFGNSLNEYKIPDKNDKMVDITGYKVHQFFCGYIQDCLAIITMDLMKMHLDEGNANLFVYVLDIIRYMGEVVLSNLKKYKTAYYNRKLLIVSPIHSILVGFDSLIYNMIEKYQFNYESFPDIDMRLKELINLIYKILVSSEGLSAIPLPCLITFMKLIFFRDVKERIIEKNFDKKAIFHTFTEHLKNLNENELKYYKRNY